MGLITHNVNHSISAGDKTFEPVQLQTEKAAIHAQYADIDTDTVELFLEQSVDCNKWNEVPNSTQVINKAKPSHMYNISILKGLWVRLGVRKNTAAAGVITVINYLT